MIDDLAWVLTCGAWHIWGHSLQVLAASWKLPPCRAALEASAGPGGHCAVQLDHEGWPSHGADELAHSFAGHCSQGTAVRLWAKAGEQGLTKAAVLSACSTAGRHACCPSQDSSKRELTAMSCSTLQPQLAVACSLHVERNKAAGCGRHILLPK